MLLIVCFTAALLLLYYCFTAGIGKTQLGIQLAVDVHLPTCFGGLQVEPHVSRLRMYTLRMYDPQDESHLRPPPAKQQ